MRSSSCSARRARGRARRRRCSPSAGHPHIATGDLFRAAVRDGTPARARGRRYMEPGQLVPDDIDDPDAPRSAREPDAGGGRSSTASRAPASRPRRSTRRSPTRGRSVTGPAHRRPARRPGRGGWPDAGSASASGHVYNVTAKPPEVSGRLRHRRLAAHPARRRQRGDRPGGMAQQIGALEEVVDHYRDACVLRPVDGRAADERGRRGACSPRSAARAGRPDMVTRKSRREIEKMALAGRIVAEVLALVEAALKPGVTTGELDRIAERDILAAGAAPSFKGYPGMAQPVPGQAVHLDRRRGRPRHPRRPGDQGRPDRVGRRRRDRRWLAWRRRRGRSSSVRRRSRSSTLVGTTREAMRPASRRRCRAITSATSRPRSRTSPSRAASASSGSSSATGSGPRCTRSRRSRTTGPAPGLKSRRASASRSSRCSRSAADEVEREPDGWTVVTSDGRLAAHFEHTIAVTENGPEILRRSDRDTIAGPWSERASSGTLRVRVSAHGPDTSE